MIIGSRWAGLNFWETAGHLGFSRTTISKMRCEQQISGWKGELSNSNNHSLKPRYAAEHIWHTTLKQQQKATLDATAVSYKQEMDTLYQLSLISTPPSIGGWLLTMSTSLGPHYTHLLTGASSTIMHKVTKLKSSWTWQWLHCTQMAIHQSLCQLPQDERRCTPCTGRQPVAGQHLRPFSLNRVVIET